ncbi:MULTISPECIES: thiol-activated cytolysin family protein [unclassified Treponema]|uniref:thiol-activated cytolysin family protein n=1 Tax=unclassified Treponema TaxID=2638727 RepID=UPI0005300EC0|nr:MULTISPECIES: thiol-activated cytolysin family protein [unclassified Treponema]AIW88926.1 tetanolysin O [Treponema sp. OMZ 838]UTC51125.1 thiol-activated cytolysin family protein [Treponema sp. OMZ 855]
MQQQKRAKPTTRMKWGSLLICLVLLGITGCQQPTKPLVKEIKTDKSVQRPSKPDKPNNGNGENTNNGTGAHSGNGQSNEQEELTYKGLDIPKTLARSPQRLRELIFQGQQLSETGPQLNTQGMVVKYIEKEVEYDVSAAFDDTLLLDPSQNSIYPGSVLRGDSLDKDSYQEIIEGNKRKAVISFDLQGVKDKEGKDGKAGITSGEIFPNLASYRELRNKILSQSITYHASANLSYEELEITNEKSLEAQLKIGVGFGAAGIKSKIAAGFKFKDGKHKERRLIKFVETFYTVDVNQEAAPLMINIPREKVGDTMPVYVSSVSYGRIAYLTIESEQEKSELKANLDTIFKVTTTNHAEADIDLAIKKLEKGTTITINIIGGGSEAVTDLKQFQKYIVKEGFSAKNPGQIIKYQLRFLDDNATAYIKYGEKYKTVERVEVPAKGYKVTAVIENIKGVGFDSADITGTIDMQPRDKDKLQKPIFTYSNTKPLPKLTVKRNDNAKPQPQPNSIMLPDESSVIQLSFDIKGTINGEEHVFVSNKQGGNPKLPTPTVNLLVDTESPLQSFTLYRKGNPAEKLVFDVRFTVEKES